MLSRHMRTDPESLLEEMEAVALRRHRTFRVAMLVLGIFGAVVGVLLLAGVISAASQSAADRYGVGAGVTAIGVYLLSSLRKPREPEVGIEALRSRAHEVVWMYVVVHPGRTTSTLAIGLVTGERHGASVPHKRRDEFLHGMAQRAPQATLGYAPDSAARFQRDPASVRRAS
jgi:hypothetical protein